MNDVIREEIGNILRSREKLINDYVVENSSTPMLEEEVDKYREQLKIIEHLLEIFE